MPPINHYRCDKCGFSFPSGWGGYLYVIDNSGKRIVCPHPIELQTAYQVLGHDVAPEVFKERTGFNSDCVCLDCLKQFELDLGYPEKPMNSMRYFYEHTKERDKRECPYCKSSRVKAVLELIGEPCPKCKVGTIKEIYTGIIS